MSLTPRRECTMGKKRGGFEQIGFGASVGRPRAGDGGGGLCIFCRGAELGTWELPLRAAISPRVRVRSGRANDTGGRGGYPPWGGWIKFDMSIHTLTGRKAPKRGPRKRSIFRCCTGSAGGRAIVAGTLG
eukprot:gene2620-biopygen15607